MNNQHQSKWKTADFTRVTLLFFAQAIFTILLFVCAYALVDQRENLLSMFLEDATLLSKCIYIFIAEILLSFIAFIYFYTDKRDFIKKTSNIIMIFLVIDLSFIVSFLVGNVNMYLRPYALCAVLMLFLVNKRTAIFVNCFFSMTMMLFDLFVNYYLVTDFEVYTALLLNFICGTLAVFIVDEEGSRLKVLLQGILVSIPVVVSAVC
ncbi:MAG: hypothetical protein J6R29_02630, partial [Clostridia bacterium]|nr:hypothetical protein [Clostridia bacterium]